MLMYDVCHIAQPQPISFYIMNITGGHPKKFLKNFILVTGWYANAIINKAKIDDIAMRSQVYIHARRSFAILHRIVKQIIHHAQQMKPVR